MDKHTPRFTPLILLQHSAVSALTPEATLLLTWMQNVSGHCHAER